MQFSPILFLDILRISLNSVRAKETGNYSPCQGLCKNNWIAKKNEDLKSMYVQLKKKNPYIYFKQNSRQNTV